MLPREPFSGLGVTLGPFWAWTLFLSSQGCQILRSMSKSPQPSWNEAFCVLGSSSPPPGLLQIGKDTLSFWVGTHILDVALTLHREVL